MHSGGKLGMFTTGVKIMKMTKKIAALILVAIVVFPAYLGARVLMTANVNSLVFSVLPTATYTIDDWLSNPNLWSVTITNSGDNKSVTYLIMKITISTAKYNPIIDGELKVVGPTNNYLISPKLGPGQSCIINNTMVQEGKSYMRNGRWSDEFVDEVLRIGFLPEGLYKMTFSIEGRYDDGTAFGGLTDPNSDMLKTEEEIDVKNPSPPELMAPMDGADDIVNIPTFKWQRPTITDLSMVNNTQIVISYNLKLWKMFDETGAIIGEEEAKNRVPIWTVENLNKEQVNFNPNDSREELISGRQYCWQVQAFDGLGRPITQTNEGKSDLWNFTVQFTSPSLNDPQTFFPLNLTWIPAKAAGTQINYTLSIADNPSFDNAFVQDQLTLPNFTYPDDAVPALVPGKMFYAKVQTTDEKNQPLGVPDQISFKIPPAEVVLSSPPDATTIPTSVPKFDWTGNSKYFKVTLQEKGSGQKYVSSVLSGTSWNYEGTALKRGTGYSWFVTPITENGEIIGGNSETRTFSLPPDGQILLVSPAGTVIDTIFPEFKWEAASGGTPGSAINYTITIRDKSENIVHTATTTETTFKYPQDAAQLKYASRYVWTVKAESGGNSIGTESVPGEFMTPFVLVEGQKMTMKDLGDALRIVLKDFPEYSAFVNKILVEISDGNGLIDPNQIVDILSKFRIVKVSIK